LARYYPGDVLVTGFDIIFFWVARMMMLGMHMMGEVPFHTIYIHGLVRDERGQKMSKSKGNVIDPLALIDQYGTDALRFAICRLTGLGRDVKLGAQVVETNRSFVTKLWNAAKFLESNQIGPVAGFDPASARLPLARWLLDSANAAVAECDAALQAYRFDEYADALYRFTWNVFCDWFLEFAKPALANDDAAATEIRATAGYVFGIMLRLLHPAIPYVTETLWFHFGYGTENSLITEAWPQAGPVHEAGAARAELDWVVRLISSLRAVRAEMNVPPSQKAPVLLRDATNETMQRAARWDEAIRRMGRASEISALQGDMPADSAQLVLDEATIILPLAGLIDIAVEKARLGKEYDKAEAEAKKVEAKLGNPDFVSRAKPEVVEENHARLASFRAEMARLKAALARLG
jgi:valyl-tRNA synthetase